ncbi:hypothetical protein B0H66DRAFT_125107 [Apodospora peruviana]|uniref:Developmental regulatory protein wetA n=1 Tax=Apodospora peruviana TaxID=516989 RepID=A0AAE0MAJ7_9PEZI|nr:hypothetical protein B0H66DRAFT_125107 [Apodospora peruviana]
MASNIEIMTFTAAGDLSQLESKESDTLCWQGAADEPDSAYFFEQYVMLDGGGAESASAAAERGESFNQQQQQPPCGAADMAFSPLMSNGTGNTPPLERASLSAVNQDEHHTTTTSVGSSSHAASSASTAELPQQSQHQHQHHHHQHQNHHRHLRGKPVVSQSHYNTSIMEQRDFTLSSHHEMPGGGSISDSELLKLEGLTMRSPRIHVPPVSASIPLPSPHSQPGSPRKAAGRLGAIYNKFRKVATLHSGRSQQQHQQQHQQQQPPPLPTFTAPVISTAQMSPGPSSKTAGSGARRKPYNLQITRPERPLSPPLTGSMSDMFHGATTDSSNGTGMQFVNGYLDDPFFHNNGLMASMGQQQRQHKPNTPLQTPLLANFASTPGGGPAHTAGWQLGQDSKTLWTAQPSSMSAAAAASSSFLTTPESSSNNGTSSSNWWGADAMDTDEMGDMEAEVAAFHRQQQQQQQINNLTMQIQQQQQQGDFEYPPPQGTEDEFAVSGLMIHMPQPRAPAPAVLQHAQHPYYAGGAISNNAGGEVNGNSNAKQQQQQQQRQRRPKPYAPSSGARYQSGGGVGGGGSGGGAMTSPCKMRSASGNRTTPSSPSPITPSDGGGGTGGSRQRLHRRSVSMNTLSSSGQGGVDGLGPTTTASSAIRKRRSWTGRRLGVSETAAAAVAAAVGVVVGGGSNFPPVPPMPTTTRGGSNTARRVSSTSSLSSSSHGMATTRNNSIATTSTTTTGSSETTTMTTAAAAAAAGGRRRSKKNQLSKNRSMPQLRMTNSSSFLQQDHYHHHHHQRQKQRRHHRHHHHHQQQQQQHEDMEPLPQQAQAPMFVNFTPEDSNVLMTGVAPSGSSKTKARREKELAEKERKLREELVRAVAATGGDVRKLEQQLEEGIMLGV